MVRIVADDDAFTAFDAADAGDDAGGMDVAGIHVEGGKLGKLKERRARVDQLHDPVARQKLAPAEVTFARAFAAAQARPAPVSR